MQPKESFQIYAKHSARSVQLPSLITSSAEPGNREQPPRLPQPEIFLDRRRGEACPAGSSPRATISVSYEMDSVALPFQQCQATIRPPGRLGRLLPRFRPPMHNILWSARACIQGIPPLGPRAGRFGRLVWLARPSAHATPELPPRHRTAQPQPAAQPLPPAFARHTEIAANLQAPLANRPSVD